MNRKMFANRDARRKLANMGGIVASSPELLGTAQRFEIGGGAFPRQEYADQLPGAQELIFDRNQYDLIARSFPEIFGKYDADNPRERRDAVREYVAKTFGKDAAREMFSRLPGVRAKDKDADFDVSTLPLMNPGVVVPREGELPLRFENLANSMETRKGLASIYQQPNAAIPSDLAEFEKIRQSMDALPEAGQLDPLAAEKALLATDNATKVMALRRRIPVEEYINSLDPEVIRRNSQRVLEAQDSASIKAQDDAVISELTSRGEMPGQLDFVSVNPSYTENQTDRFNNLDKSSLTEPVTDAIVPRPRDIRDQDPRTLNLGQKAVQDLVIAEENKESPGLLQSGFDYSQLKPEEKPSFMDVLNLGADITVEGTKRIDQALFGDYEDKLLPVGSVPTATEEVREINERLKNETDPLRIQVLNRRREELLGKLNLEEFDKDAKEFIMSLPQTAGDLVGKAGSALYRLYQENVVASNDPEAAYNNLTSLAESDAFTEKLIELRDEEANQKEAAREKELAELKAGGSDPEFKTMDQARLEAQNVILNKPSEKTETKTKTETPNEETGAAKVETATNTGAGAGAGATNAEIVTTTENAVNNATKKGGDTNEAASKALLDTAGVDTSNMSTKERVTSFKNLLSGLAGDTEEEKKEEFWMNMAMIGFGVAAGESESALKNIADGLLAGSSQMLKSRAKRKDRDDKFTMAALDNVLAEQRAETQFGRDVKLAGIRAGAGSKFEKLPTFTEEVNDYVKANLSGNMYYNTPIKEKQHIAAEIVGNMPAYSKDPEWVEYQKRPDFIEFIKTLTE